MKIRVLTFSESQVLLNASDVEGDVELVGISYDGPDGIFSVNGDGTCSFAPNENFNGQVQLDVTIRDEDGAEVETVINVDVLPINRCSGVKVIWHMACVTKIAQSP
ncbi:cadherin-like domain-containing protein [Vibrio chagasii]|nr:cadherin-like domain-containing protein [Vibrio chagasii]